ncbi:MAG: gliding motility protein GldN [Filimonas sp.]|nr:gliding motility protein GldN [Filimonas sp.]
MRYSAHRYLLVTVLAASLVAQHGLAQRNQRKSRTNTANKNADGTDYLGNPVNNTSSNKSNSAGGDYLGGTPGDTSKKKNSANASGLNVPIEFVPTKGNPLTDTVRRSLRSEDAIERNLVKDRTPLAYENIREDDAIYRQRVWRIIDTREKMNLSFRNPAQEDGNNQLFISLLYKAITEDSIVAFKDERFTEPYTKDEFLKKFSGGLDTVPVMDLDGNVVKKQVRQREFMVDSIYQYQIKEEWIFDKESSRMFVRILGIAPMMKTYLSDGTAIDQNASPLFWVYYPDMRPVLAKSEVYNSKNYGARMSWEELFESRFFTARIVKSTLNNPFNMYLKEYVKDPLFQLLEGENIKETIFNYEQSLWSY